jgi:hypothetical protein
LPPTSAISNSGPVGGKLNEPQLLVKSCPTLRASTFSTDALPNALRRPGTQPGGDVVAPSRDPEMKCFGGDVGAVGPADRAELMVEFDSSEAHRILQRLEDATPVPVRRIDFPADAVVERDAQAMLADDLDLDDPMQMSRQVHYSRC